MGLLYEAKRGHFSAYGLGYIIALYFLFYEALAWYRVSLCFFACQSIKIYRPSKCPYSF